MLGALYQADTDRALDQLAKLPPEPPKKPERSAWGVPWRFTKAAAADVLGSVADVVKGYGAASAMTLEGDPIARAALGDKAVREGAQEGRRQIAEGEALTSEVGRSFRSVAEDMRPDPATAGTAEQLVFSVGRPLVKLVGAGVTLGPIGIGLASAEEGMTQAEDLRQQGVDVATRTKVGALGAVATGASAFLPMAGPTLKATAGLYLAGGPGAFMAQQALTRSILERANYAEIAKQYDPLDPMGLAVSSLIPLPFAAYGAARNIRANKKAPAASAKAPPGADQAPATPSAAPESFAPPEAVDAAMVHNLTLLRDEQAARRIPDQPVTAAPAGPVGTFAEVVTERGMVAPVRYRLAEAGDLITSHGDDLAANPAFPAELQPRDRTRAASADQVARIENAIRPELLGESVKASDGAPIIGPDAVVESGNARTIALRRAYESGKAEDYRAWLTQNAAHFGLDAEQVQGMRRPVLVRERGGQIDRAEFARQANESAVAALSPAEQARSDAARLRDLDGLVANDDGTVNLRESASFVRRFMQDAVSPTERGGMLQGDGRLSQGGQQRLRNAIFAKAYGDPALLAALTESTDSNVRNILAGMLRAAPDVARLRDLIDAGARPPVDFAPDLVRAVRELDALRSQGRSLANALAQGDMLGGSFSPALHNLLVGLAENARAPRRVAEMVRRMVQAVDSLGDPRQASMLDAPAVKPENLAADAVERMRSLTDEQLTGSEPTPSEPKVDALMRSVNDRVRAVEMQSPELRVTDDATVADFMAQVRREAVEGTETELGALDADLLRVAADCALSSATGAL